MWKLFFKGFVKEEDYSKPLTTKILYDALNPLTCIFLKIYTMELFVYPTLNKACRDQDGSKINTMGAYANVLSIIVNGAEGRSRSNDPEKLTVTSWNDYKKNNMKYTTLYRGLNLTTE